MGIIAFENITDEIKARLPKYPMPVLHVGQLATDIRFQGKGVSPLLLRFAAEQAVAASKSVSCFAIQPEADNERARNWYLKRGFMELQPGGSRFYQSIAALEKAMGLSPR